MGNPVRPWEPPNQFTDLTTGALTRRADAFLRDWFHFTGAANGKVPVGSLGGNGTDATTFLREDGTFAVPNYPVGANPTAPLGLSIVNGSALTWMRSDAAPALDQGIVPTWTALHIFSAGIQGTTINFSSSITGDSLIAVNGFGCNGKTAQTEVTVNASVATTAATQTLPYGYSTQAQADNIVALLNQIRAALVSNGILV
jgi:hypothetical protein